MLKRNTATRLLKNGEPAVGMWMSIPSSVSAEAMPTQGRDWLTLDVEHGCFNYETQQTMFLAIASQGTVPLARIPTNDTTISKQTLDASAMGVVVPMVCSAEEARAAVEARKYRPEGIRSAGGGRRRMPYGPDWQSCAN